MTKSLLAVRTHKRNNPFPLDYRGVHELLLDNHLANGNPHLPGCQPGCRRQPADVLHSLVANETR